MRSLAAAIIRSMIIGTGISALTWLSHAETQQNLISNPGFERTDAKGNTKDWHAFPPVYRYVDGEGRNGSRGLVFENSDPHFYSFPKQKYPAHEGQIFTYKIWIKAENIQGRESGAGICIQWYDQRGKWIGGNYPRGMKDTGGEWKCIKGLSRHAPKGTAFFSVSPYVRKGNTGKAWFDDLQISEFLPEPVENITTSCYRNIAAAEKVTISATLNLKEHEIKKNHLQGGFTIFSNGKKMTKFPATLFTAQRASATFDASKLSDGLYTIRASVFDQEGKVKGQSEIPFTRVGELPKWKVWIDRHQRTVVNGKPFFPLGMYWSRVNEKDLNIYEKGPFNCLMPYGAPNRDELDLCDEKGLKVIYSIKDIYYGSRYAPKQIKTTADETAFIQKKVSLYQNHPALLAWYINDEHPLEMLPRLIGRRQLMEKLDPNHPTWTVLYQYSEIGNYLLSFDVVGSDPYPIPKFPISNAQNWTRIAYQQTHGSRALWQVPQACNLGSYHPDQFDKMRAPTLDEMRSMTWQCIANGANGLIYYSFYDLSKKETQAKEPFEKRWADVCATAQEVKNLIPILLSTDTPPTVTGGRTENISTRCWRKGKDVYLVVVNSAREQQQATIKLSESFQKVEAIFGTNQKLVNGSTLKISLGSIEPVFLKLQ